MRFNCTVKRKDARYGQAPNGSWFYVTDVAGMLVRFYGFASFERAIEGHGGRG